MCFESVCVHKDGATETCLLFGALLRQSWRLCRRTIRKDYSRNAFLCVISTNSPDERQSVAPPTILNRVSECANSIYVDARTIPTPTRLFLSLSLTHCIQHFHVNVCALCQSAHRANAADPSPNHLRQTLSSNVFIFVADHNGCALQECSVCTDCVALITMRRECKSWCAVRCCGCCAEGAKAWMQRRRATRGYLQ